MAEALLTLAGVSKYYTGNQSVVVGLNDIDLSFSRGEFVAITGESGSGKSTLSHVISGILPYESGEMLLNGEPTSHYDSLDWEQYRRDNISFISQNYGILPGATVLKNVITALILAGMDRKRARDAAERILKQVELWELRARRAAKLSSGQKQRLSIARALAKPAPILVADEPTGNLDSENSAKVVELLARAAGERLVIMVTHEFDEVKDLATRHIVLQDGEVVLDTPLRPAARPDRDRPPETGAAKKRPMSFFLARLQLASRPVWSAMMAGIFALTAFAVFAFLGVFIISLDDTSTRIYDGAAFPNGSKTRLAVLNSTLTPMTEEDYAAMLSVEHVASLEPWGYAADVRYAYREGTDYRVDYRIYYPDPEKSDEHYVVSDFTILPGAPFVQTIPMLPEGKTFLAEGRLPENFFEVVTADPSLSIGDTVRLYLLDEKVLNPNRSFQVDVTVVGTTETGSGLWFHRDVGRFLRQLKERFRNEETTGCLYLPSSEVESGSFIASWTYWNTFRDILIENYPYLRVYGLGDFGTDPFVFKEEEVPEITFRSEDTGEDGQPVERTLRPLLDGVPDGTTRTKFRFEAPGFIDAVVSFEDFDALTWHTPLEQVSLTIEDYAYTDQVIGDLAELGYGAVSPYRLGSTRQDPELAAQRTQTLRVCLAALAAIVVLQIVLIRAMFSMETESYRLLSNIGLTGRLAKWSVLWQALLFTVLGQILGALGIWACAAAGVQRIRELLRYLPARNIAILSGIHLAAGIVAAAWAIHALGRQVYPLSGRQADIALEEKKGGRQA